MKKNSKRLIKKNLELKKYLKEKAINYMPNGKNIIIHLIVGLIKMNQYFPKPFNPHFGDSIKIKIDLSNYATKTDIKKISHVDTSSFALKTNLSSLKTEVDKSDVDKLVPVPNDLSKLSNVEKIMLLKKLYKIN